MENMMLSILALIAGLAALILSIIGLVNERRKISRSRRAATGGWQLQKSILTDVSRKKHLKSTLWLWGTIITAIFDSLIFLSL